MWYFSWILGTGLALSFAVLNAIWYEIIERQPEKSAESEGIIESGENRGTVAAVTDVDVTHHEGPRDAPKTHPGDRM